MSSKMNPVIHFEMPAEDNDRVRKFYESAFGWQITPLGPEMGDFMMAFSVETEPKTRLPKKVGAINGGFYKKAGKDDQVKLTILVDDIQDAIKKVKAAGGKVLGEVFEMPGVGLFVSFRDTEGNLITLNQDFTVKQLPDVK